MLVAEIAAEHDRDNSGPLVVSDGRILRTMGSVSPFFFGRGSDSGIQPAQEGELDLSSSFESVESY